MFHRAFLLIALIGATRVFAADAASKLAAQGLAEINKGEYSAAISHLDRAVQRGGNVSSYFLLGWAHYQRGFKQGSVENADRDDAQSAIDAYESALQLDSRLRGLSDPSRLYFSMALCEEAVGANEKALQAYKSALRVAPGKPLILLYAARLRFRLKDRAKAKENLEMAVARARKSGQEEALQSAAENDPGFAGLLSDAGMRRILGVSAAGGAKKKKGEDPAEAQAPSHAAEAAQDPALVEKIAVGNMEFKFLRYQNAVNAYTDAIAINERSPSLDGERFSELYEKLGATYIKMGQAGEAEDALKNAVLHDPSNASARYLLAQAYAMSSRSDEALKALKDAFASATDSSELHRILLLSKTDAEFDGLRDQPEFKHAVAQAVARTSEK
jgi:tetratricopeptide (TPR) repeat protein